MTLAIIYINCVVIINSYQFDGILKYFLKIQYSCTSFTYFYLKTVHIVDLLCLLSSTKMRIPYDANFFYTAKLTAISCSSKAINEKY